MKGLSGKMCLCCCHNVYHCIAQQLTDAVKRFDSPSQYNWKEISCSVPTRNSSQCRERWLNILDPNLKSNNFNREENAKLMEICKKYQSQGNGKIVQLLIQAQRICDIYPYVIPLLLRIVIGMLSTVVVGAHLQPPCFIHCSLYRSCCECTMIRTNVFIV